MMFWSFLSIYLKLMKKKEMGKMEGKNKAKLTNHNLSFLIVCLYKKTTFPKPIFFFLKEVWSFLGSKYLLIKTASEVLETDFSLIISVKTIILTVCVLAVCIVCTLKTCVYTCFHFLVQSFLSLASTQASSFSTLFSFFYIFNSP